MIRPLVTQSLVVMASLALLYSFAPISLSFYASDPLTQANIYLYPKPHKVSDLVLKNAYWSDGLA